MTSSLTQRMNMFSPWLSFSLLRRDKTHRRSSRSTLQFHCKHPKVKVSKVSGADKVPQEVEVLQGVPRIRGLEFAREQHEQADEVEASDHRRVSWFLAHCRGTAGGEKVGFKVGNKDALCLSLKGFPLTQLSALAGRLEQQLQLVQHQRHVHGVAAQSLHPEQEGHGRLELGGEEQHLEVEEGLLAGREMGLACRWEPTSDESVYFHHMQSLHETND